MKFSNLRRFLLVFIGALLGLCFFVSISYAYYTGSASVANATGVSSGAQGDVVLIDGTAITLTGDKAAPISDSKALSSTNYRNQFQIRNDKSSSVNVNVYMVPTSSSTMNSSAVKYALYDSTGTKPTTGTSMTTTSYTLTSSEKSLITSKSYTPGNTGYKIGSFSIGANSTKTLYLYLWINRNETGSHNATLNTKFEGVILLKTA